MSDYRPLDKEQLRTTPRKMEKVGLAAGDVCVKGLMTADFMTIAEKSRRPAIDPRGGIDEGEAILWQVILSCYASDAEDAPRLFNPDQPGDIQALYRMPQDEFRAILAAINRVNGLDATEAELMRDFSQVPLGVRLSPSTPSVSSSSAGSPQKLTFPSRS
jgi:hypothetical protein